MFYNFTYNVHVYTLVILPICEISIWHLPLLCVQWKTPYDGQRKCAKHVEFYSKNKFEKLVHLVGFLILLFCMGVNLVAEIAGEKEAEGVLEHGVEENIWT